MNPFVYVFRLLHWFQGRRLALAAVAGCLIVEASYNAFVPMAFQRLVDDAIIPHDSTVLVRILIALGIATLLTTAAGMTGDYIYASLSSGVLGDIRQRLFDHLQTLSPSFYQKYSAGEIAALYSTDLAGVEQTLGNWIPWGWKPALDIISFNAVMFTVDWRLAIFAQLVWPVALFGPRFFAPRAGVAAEQRKDKEAAVLTAVNEATAGCHVVRAFGLSATMSERFGKKVKSLVATSRRGVFFCSAVDRSARVGILILQIIVLGVGAAMAVRGKISVGGLAAFYKVFASLSHSLLSVVQYSTSLINSAAGLVRLEEALNQRSAVPDAPDAVELPAFHDAIRLCDYDYAPMPNRRILDRVSLTIRQGECVAVVGLSGSGKSTLLSAIMCVFDPNEGKIEIDGRDLRAVTKTSLVGQSAVVFQESFLYNTTIRENVRVGRLNATDAEIVAACRDAEIHEIIMAMPLGYDSLVGERGSLLPGGQKQRLAIARALLRNPRILFLDEATSALDPGTEIAINRTLARIAQDRTVLAATHRLAATINFDRIVVMDEGRLAESGTHAELLKQNGLYAAMWRKQDGIRTSDDGSRADITVERLKQFSLLAQLDDAMLSKLATKQFATENVPAGQVVIVEGDRGDKFYIIARGKVEVLKRDPSGCDQSVRVLECGDNFGELALLRDVPRSMTIRTLVPCTFLTLQRHHFQDLVDNSPAVRDAILAQETERQSTTKTLP
jgi:ATP-binding cassette subfamily B protein